MKKTVGCFTDEKLRELSEQENTVVMQPTYDTVFEAWPASKVNVIVDTVVAITNRMHQNTEDEIKEECFRNASIHEFSKCYQTMFQKLVNPLFVSDKENIGILKRMIMLKSAVDNNVLTSQSAQAQVSDLALKSLASRVANSRA